VPSWIINSLAYTFITFVLGGVAAWVPEYLFERESLTQPTAAAVAKLAAKRDTDGKPAVPPEVIAKLRPLESKEVEKGAIFRQKLKDALTQPEFILYGSTIEDALAAPHSPTLSELDLIFGLIVVVGGLLATLAGGVLGDRLRARYPGSYFLVSGWGALLSVPFFAGMLLLPLPLAWLSLFVAVFGLFLNTGPSSTILANVVPVEIRGSSFAINIFIIHAFGDAISPALIGRVADVSNLQTAFLMCTVMIAAGGVIWLLGSKHLQRDTERAAELLK
jgi:sugar phosphate permease